MQLDPEPAVPEAVDDHVLNSQQGAAPVGPSATAPRGQRLRDLAVVVTGAGSGIGRAIAVVFASEGARVSLVGRRLAPLQEVQEAIRRAQGDARVIPADVTVAEDQQRIVAETMKAFGSLDVLVNNAGTVDFGTVADCSDAVWERVMNTNLKGVFQLSRAAVQVMIPKKKGSIVNVASILGTQATRNAVAYCAAKGGLVNLTRSMALDLAPHRIRVNCINPGMVDTPMNADHMPGPPSLSTRLLLKVRYIRRRLAPKVRRWEKVIPLGRVGQPRDIAYAALYYASDESAWTTGSVLSVDGGMTAEA